jgi:xanthine dehydrogenase small subunit
VRLVVLLTTELVVDGVPVVVEDSAATLLTVLREQLGITSVKDGCSPQGQCGCCTVLVDGEPRVSCVTPVRRISGREVTTLDGLDAASRDRWLSAFTACGASQCGFCTPGIVLRLEGAARKVGVGAAVDAGSDIEAGSGDGASPRDDSVAERALAAHLCRCTGWRTIIDAWHLVTGQDNAAEDDNGWLAGGGLAGRDPAAAARRAGIEGGTPQQVGPAVAAGDAGFADDTAPPGAIVAVPDGGGAWALGRTPAAAREASAKVQGRRTTVAATPPLDLPETEDALDGIVRLRTSWVEPAYLETDASWCVPGGEPADPTANGGAFGGKVDSPAPAMAQRMANELGQPYRVLLAREDTVRLGAKRPPIAAAVHADGTGVVRVTRTPGIVEAIRSAAPGLQVEEVDVPGPPTSVRVRAAGWAEAAVLVAAATGGTSITSPEGAVAAAGIDDDGSIRVRVACGEPLDEVVLRSYCIGAAHMALGWVTSEALAVDADGTIGDLTVRSFGIPRAADTPPITVAVDPSLGDTTGPPVRGSDAVFAAVALAIWRHQGFPTDWPTGQPLRSRQ